MPQDIVGTEGFTNGVYTRLKDGDRGDDIFDTLEVFMERMATHTHSGADSSSISLNIEKDITELVQGVTLFWTDLGDNNFVATIPVAAGAAYDTSIRKYFLQTAGGYTEFYPTIEKVDAQNYLLYANEALSPIRVVTL